MPRRDPAGLLPRSTGYRRPIAFQEHAEVDPSDVLALPAALVASTPHISAIVVARDGSLSLLLEPSTVTFAEDTVIGEELCQSRS